MKIYLFPVVIGGFLITIILQAFMYSTVGMQTALIQEQLEQINQKIDKLENITLNQTTPEISKSKISETINQANSQLTSDNGSDLLSPENLSKTLGTASSDTPATSGKKVTLKASWNSVDVYETTKASSRVVGKIESGKTYPFNEKKLDWYQIKLDTGTTAWVQAQFVYETL